ncbi:transcriptional antiterminator [Paenibacillus sp. SORGH_AS306]|uniref:PRD domain-containing protein n=1 Tax=Paenibacillus kyungheensis TaxID=1452732 RepID=A0AAX3M0B6_9BACL|nr:MULTISPECIES: PRD domain-containing protein [Paenibacillus]MDQ1236141.1 transcriptional antiterminator [Paenibacillus sp. SORGH_AS_0306]MDR6108496.1 transcriptional antiterminator [Paenibacillus sp. SORGH_AS_0338]WCT55594.1 PRD domain-containing protein [Paenibacillus kyungheensis]
MSKESMLLSIQRVVGNNIVMAFDESTDIEYVLLGKGLGFAAKNETTLSTDDDRIEKRFRLEDREQLMNHPSFFEDIDHKAMEVSDQIIQMIEQRFNKTLHNKIYLALPSHIQFTVYRVRHHMEITNPFLYETQVCFPQEYEVALQALQMICSAFDIKIPEDEAGFLTYHIHSAVSHVPVGQLVKMSTLLGKLQAMIEQEKQITFQQGSMNQVRLMIHLRFSLERIVQGSLVENLLIQPIREQYAEEYILANKMKVVMEKELNVSIPEDEVCFLTMHLYRLFRTYQP